KAAGEAALIAPHRGFSRGIALLAQPQDLAAGALRAGAARIIGFEAAARDPGLEAAMLAAIAGRPRNLVATGPGQRVVTPFAGDAVRTVMRSRVEGDAGAAAGAEDGGEHPLE